MVRDFGLLVTLMHGMVFQGEPEAVDVLFDGVETHEIRARFVQTENLHGGWSLLLLIMCSLLVIRGSFGLVQPDPRHLELVLFMCGQQCSRWGRHLGDGCANAVVACRGLLSGCLLPVH